MIAKYNTKSFIFGIPGLILQVGGNIAARTSNDDLMIGLGGIATLVGTVLLMVGIAYYAKAKGRHPAWCLMALLSIIGLIVLACLKDHAPDGGRTHA